MSFRCWSQDGWGVCMSPFIMKYKDDIKDNLLELMKGTVIEEYVLQSMKETPDEEFETILNELAENDSVYGNPYGWILATIINEKEGTKIEAFSVDDYNEIYIGIVPEYPFSDYENQPKKSKEEYTAIFKKYLSYITYSDITTDWIAAYYSG